LLSTESIAKTVQHLNLINKDIVTAEAGGGEQDQAGRK
jgi:hypothetical protein